MNHEVTLSDQLIEYNIENIWRRRLCTGCGTCSGICPNNAIEMCICPDGIYAPIVINNEPCRNCRLCLSVCPGAYLDAIKLNEYVFDKQPQEFFLGNYTNCYMGHSLNEKIRACGTSGGLVTTILVSALEAGMIDGALVTRMSVHNPLKPEVMIARDVEELISASKSKYCPVPVNAALKEILHSNERFVVVGLPCHIQGIRKAEVISKRLRERIVLHLGLFCYHTESFTGTDFLLQKMKVQKQDVVQIDYRGKGWPGGMLIKLKDTTERFVPYPDYWGGIFGFSFFTPIRCILCSDATNELADLSFGDAWFPELRKNKLGESIVISRTLTGEKLLRQLQLEREIEISKISSKKVMLSHGELLRFKKKHLKARILLLKFLGNNTPAINTKLLEPTVVSYINAILIYLCIRIGSKNLFQNLLRHIPFSILRKVHTRFL